MIQSKELLKSKPFPKWIANHPIFKSVDKVVKVFPSIGLPNSQSEINLDNGKIATKAAKDVLRTLSRNMEARIDGLAKYFVEHQNMSDERQNKMKLCSHLLSELKNKINRAHAPFLNENNGRITLNLPEDFLDLTEKAIFRRGEGLFRVYNKLNELLREGRFAAMPKLEDIDSFKRFSTDNVPNNKFNIVFSSDGAEGTWDIATMSQRGVKSCQSWDGEYKHCLIGSILDPFVGIMYLTSGAKFNEYGTKMMKRSVVRFVVNGDTKKPFILVDNMYPEYDKTIFEAFKKFIQDKTGNKFEVHYAPTAHNIIKNSYMPSNDVIKKIKQFDKNHDDEDNYDDDDYDYYESIRSYQDTHVPEQLITKDKQADLFDKNSRKKENKFSKIIAEAITIAGKEISVAEFPDSLKPIIRRLKGEEKKAYNYSYLLSELGNKIARDIIKSVSKSDFINSDTYIRRVHYNYFNLRNKLLETNKTKFVRELNGSLNLKAPNRLRGDNFVSLMKILLPKIDSKVRESLKQVVDKRKPTEALPLPG